MLSRVNVGGGGGAIGDPSSGMAIIVKYPIGAECTCSNGTKTYKANDSAGACIFYVPSTGSWTITADLNGSAIQKTVTVSSIGIYEIELVFEYVLFDDTINRFGSFLYGNAETEVTITSSLLTVQGHQSGEFYPAYSTYKIDITDAENVVMTGSFEKYSYNLEFGFCDNTPQCMGGPYKNGDQNVVPGGYDTFSSSRTFTNTAVLNVSSLTGEHYFYFKTHGDNGGSATIVNKLELSKISLSISQ